MYGVRRGAGQACEDVMKRHLLTIAMFLLLGAVVNVAVAWGCALWSSATRAASGRPPIRVLP